MKFEWDNDKEQLNQQKHFVAFSYATRIFLDEYRLERIDDRKSYGEIRYIVLGEIEQRVFLVVYTWRNEICRIISARRANSREQKIYYKIRAKI